MSRYRRAKITGGTFFFTVTLADRSSDLLVSHVDRLRSAYRTIQRRRPFETVAICILPDHLHAIWTLPDDADYSTRWNLIKSNFSRSLPATPSRSSSKIAKREKGIWQRRYREHLIRDDDDLTRHIDYIHFNPVKHGLVTRVVEWPHSSFHNHVASGLLPSDWGGDMRDISGSYGETLISVGTALRAFAHPTVFEFQTATSLHPRCGIPRECQIFFSICSRKAGAVSLLPKRGSGAPQGAT
jgi:putative transposase